MCKQCLLKVLNVFILPTCTSPEYNISELNTFIYFFSLDQFTAGHRHPQVISINISCVPWIHLLPTIFLTSTHLLCGLLKFFLKFQNATVGCFLKKNYAGFPMTSVNPVLLIIVVPLKLTLNILLSLTVLLIFLMIIIIIMLIWPVYKTYNFDIINKRVKCVKVCFHYKKKTLVIFK